VETVSIVGCWADGNQFEHQKGPFGEIFWVSGETWVLEEIWISGEIETTSEEF
jgi:hypothetical protein